MLKSLEPLPVGALRCPGLTLSGQRGVTVHNLVFRATLMRKVEAVGGRAALSPWWCRRVSQQQRGNCTCMWQRYFSDRQINFNLKRCILGVLH